MVNKMESLDRDAILLAELHQGSRAQIMFVQNAQLCNRFRVDVEVLRILDLKKMGRLKMLLIKTR